MIASDTRTARWRSQWDKLKRIAGAMTEHVQKPISFTREVALPVGVIVTLGLFAFNLGGVNTAREIATAANTAGVANLTAKVLALENREIERKVREEVRDEKLRKLATNLGLLKDFTEGRISNMPYRPVHRVPDADP